MINFLKHKKKENLKILKLRKYLVVIYAIFVKYIYDR